MLPSGTTQIRTPARLWTNVLEFAGIDHKIIMNYSMTERSGNKTGTYVMLVVDDDLVVDARELQHVRPEMRGHANFSCAGGNHGTVLRGS